jgi:hypothetical protein
VNVRFGLSFCSLHTGNTALRPVLAMCLANCTWRTLDGEAGEGTGGLAVGLITCTGDLVATDEMSARMLRGCGSESRESPGSEVGKAGQTGLTRRGSGGERYAETGEVGGDVRQKDPSRGRVPDGDVHAERGGSGSEGRGG